MAEITRSVTNDFGGIPPIVGQLSEQIIAQAIFTSVTFYGASLYQDVVTFHLSGSPNGGENSALDAFITTYVNDNTPPTSGTKYVPINSAITDTSYSRLISLIHDDETNVLIFRLSSFTYSTDTDYTIGIFSATDNKFLLENTFTNTEQSTILTLGTLTNGGATLTLPTFPALLEVWGKRGSQSNDVYVNGIDVDF